MKTEKKTKKPNAKTQNSKPTAQEEQDVWIQRIRYAWRNKFKQEIDPPQIQMLVHGTRKKRKFEGFGTYEALGEWIISADVRKIQGSAFVYALGIADTEAKVEPFRKRARKRTDPELIGEVLKDMVK